MSDWSIASARRHDDITVPAIRVAFVLSLLIHGIALWTWLPRMRLLTPSDTEQGEVGSPLAVKLMPPQIPPGAMSVVAAAGTPGRAADRRRAARRRPSLPRIAPSAPPVLALPRNSRDVLPQRVTPSDAAPSPPTPTGEPDLSSYIEARRRARGESEPAEPASPSTAPSTENDNDRMNKIIAANIGLNAKPTFGNDPKNGGGLFQIKSMEFSEAEFYFFGWDKDISRNAKQLIEVRRGDNPDIRIAVIRRMIAIVREHETGDFLWESPRLGRQLTLSARLKDNAELEAFLMQEFFSDPRRRN